MTNNEKAYRLLEEIRASLIVLIEEKPFLSYREIVERVLKLEGESQFDEAMKNELWHTVYLHQDVCQFEPMSKQNIAFLKKVKDGFR
ncbi:hypothetical protein JOC54_003081 [Alkalihalobacillus xiaoxiensis]|uniref:Uncharacterized protein n=1 Tax=Shouchella xiaoxiensis TaxID=766895 RepID=A0ABS2SXQ3_9BACI|nr:hypothetical protein [Shouchella xiaoxiensis]MBM7839801.1 hypothetical protein [Shouchella xiaoxiensis]